MFVVIVPPTLPLLVAVEFPTAVFVTIEPPTLPLLVAVESPAAVFVVIVPPTLPVLVDVTFPTAVFATKLPGIDPVLMQVRSGPTNVHCAAAGWDQVMDATAAVRAVAANSRCRLAEPKRRCVTWTGEDFNDAITAPPNSRVPILESDVTGAPTTLEP